MKNINNLQTLILTVIILLTVSLGCQDIDKKDTAAPPKTAQNTAPDAPANNAPPKETVSNIKWSDYDNVYNTKSNSTDMQKENLWKNFEGKTVTWQGTVDDVSKGMMGGLSLNVKMNPDTMTHDISLDLKEDQQSKAAALTKGKKVTFTGKLVSYGGAILPLKMEDGEIK